MSQEVLNDLNQLHATFLETANKNEITCDDIQHLVSFTEEFHQNIVIAHESGLVSSDCISHFEEVLTSIQQHQTSCNKKSIGRPKLCLSKDQIEFLLSIRVTKNQISRMLGVSTRTITRRMDEYNLASVEFSDLTDQELDSIVTKIHQQFPQSGYRQVLAVLNSQGIFVRERRLRASLQRVDQLGSALKWFTLAIQYS